MNWAQEELQTIHVGDKRLDKRAMILLETLMSDPTESIPTVSQDWSETLAAYQFFKNGKTDKDKILAAHLDSTLDRAAQGEVVLAIQDTTELDFTRPEESPQGAGPLNYSARRGFLDHTQILMTPERLVLGVVDFQMWGRDKLGKKKTRKQRPIEKKESFRWLEGYEQACDVARRLPDQKVVSIGDAECDIYELFVATQTPEVPLPTSLRKAHFIARACENRCVTERDPEAGKHAYRKIQQELDDTPPLCQAILRLPKTPQRTARDATMEIRATAVHLKAPQRKGRKLPEVDIHVVRVREVSSPEDENESPVEWTLLTDLPIDSIEDVETIIEYYACRWQIEVFFRVLKTGCTVEKLQLSTQDRLETCLAFYKIVAWRVMYLTMLGREYPDLPCDILFSEAEWKSVWMVVEKTDPPQTPPRLEDFLAVLASLGGYLRRNHDGPPGPKALWVGIRRATDLALGWHAFGPHEH